MSGKPDDRQKNIAAAGRGPALINKSASASHRRISLLGSVAVHIVLLLALSFAGLFQPPQVNDDITEVSVLGGGGGGGGGSEGEEQGTEADTALPEETQPSYKPQQDAIYEQSDKASVAEAKPAAKPKPRGGGGKGTGQGSGTGSGFGPGSGSGSGGGHGSGHGTGIGSGFGPGSGSGAYANPAVPPRLIRSIQPVYPEQERKAGIEGTVVVQILVGKNGSAETVSVLTSSGSPALDAAAIKACSSWKFTSARSASGQKVRCYVSVPMMFRLRK